MAVKRLLAVLICVSAIASPLTSSASYIIHLKNGRQIVTSKYWKQNNKILFYIDSGVAEIRENVVLRIDEKGTSNEIVTKLEEKVKNVNTSNVENKSQETKDIDIEEYKNKKEQIKFHIEDVLEKYREASSKRDKEEQERLRQEISALSKQVFDINDTVKQKNHGRLPDGWEQE